MSKLRYVGLDVHKDSIVIAVAEEGRSEAQSLCTIPNDWRRLQKQLLKIAPAADLRCCYEAGPTGYALYRRMVEAGIDCVVVAPSLVPVKSGNRVKTDRRDAKRLAHFHRSGDLTPIWVPDAQTEAMRDLERARDDAKKAERVARQQLGKFLLRRDRIWRDGRAWSVKHLEWVRRQQFDDPIVEDVLVDYTHAVEEATSRVERLEKSMADHVEGWSRQDQVVAYQALRGIRLINAVTLAAELGDLRRFKTAGQLMSYLGLTCSEHSSGDSRKLGRITRAGNGRARRALVEAAWSYRYKPRMSYAIRKRNEEVGEGVKTIAWKAQVRLHSRWRLLCARGKKRQTVVCALARELAGFLWAIAREPELVTSQHQ